MILVNPLSGVITSAYNPNRMHPVLKRVVAHWGTDIGGRPRGGTHNIHAAADGVVISAYGNYQRDSAATRFAKRFLSRLTGNHVVIEHKPIGGRTFRTYYGHLNNVSVKTGDRVDAGEVIGTQGATGDVSGAHLHLEVWIGGQTTDPEAFFATHGAMLGSGPTTRIGAIMAKLDKDDYENIAKAVWNHRTPSARPAGEVIDKTNHAFGRAEVFFQNAAKKLGIVYPKVK